MDRGTWWATVHEVVHELSLHQVTLILLLTCVLSCFSPVRLFVTHGLQPARLLCPWDSLRKNIRVSCHVLLQGILSAQGLNPHLLSLLHWQVTSLPLVPLTAPTYENKQQECLTLLFIFQVQKLRFVTLHSMEPLIIFCNHATFSFFTQILLLSHHRFTQAVILLCFMQFLVKYMLLCSSMSYVQKHL